MTDEYLINRNLYLNVYFYSCEISNALDISP